MSINIRLNGKPIEVGVVSLALLKFLKQQGIDVPTLCHWPQGKRGPSCLVCLVKIKGKIQPGCSLTLEEGMEIITEDSDLKEARKDSLILLLNRCGGACFMDPESCPSRGKCKLQSLGKQYGITTKDLLPKGKTPQTKEDWGLILFHPRVCILCGRCIQMSRANAQAEEPTPYFWGKGHQMHLRIRTPGNISLKLAKSLVAVCPQSAFTLKENL